MLLDKKTAIVYGAAGAIGSAVARAYAGRRGTPRRPHPRDAGHGRPAHPP